MQAYINRMIPHYTLGNPHEISLHIYFSGCNFRCGYCYTPELLTFDEKHLVDLKDVKHELRLNHEVIKSIFFTGGEPCLQKDALLQLAQFSRMLGLRVSLDTNGSRPDVLQELLEHQLIDAVYLDVKTPLSPALFERVTHSRTFFVTSDSLLAQLRKSFSILHDFHDSIEVVIITPIIPNLIYHKEDLLSLGDIVQDIASRWILRRFRNDKVLFEKKLQKIKEPTFDFMEMLREMLAKKYPQLVVEID